MAESLHPRKSLLLALTILSFNPLLIPQVQTAPTDAASTGLNYELGHTYVYNYETLSNVKLVGTSNEESQVKLRGQVQLTPLKTNDFVLTLKDFTLDVTSPNEKIATPIAALGSTSSRFTVQEGAISGFYVNGDYSAWVANIHRAITSAFANPAFRDRKDTNAFYYENDVSGKNCPSEYTIQSNGNFNRRRDLNKCQNRDGGYSTQFGVPFTPPGILGQATTSDTSIHSNQVCTFTYSNGVLGSSFCDEKHHVSLLTPGKHVGGAANVTATLQYNSITPKSISAQPSQLSSIYFDHSGTELKKSGDDAGIQYIESLTASLCLTTTQRFSSQPASSFLTLRSKVRTVSKKVLETVYDKLSAGGVCQVDPEQLKTVKKLYIEAAAMAASPDSIAFVAQLIKDGVVSDKTQKRFRLFAAFADKPTDQTLKVLADLINQDFITNPKYLLTASGVAHQYCLGTNKNCNTNPEYINLVKQLATKTEQYCQAQDNESTKRAIIGLQALGNLDSLTSPAISAITTCLTKSDRIKIHALQAFRRHPCQEDLKVQARKILKSANTPHVRISAYLALSRCYLQEDSDTLRSLNWASSTQVRNFIASHRLKAWSTSPREKALDAGALYQKDSNGNDPRKISSTVSFSLEEMTFSADIIFGDDSFLPKIITGNSSIQLFGADYNTVEVGAVLGGLEEDLMEKAYGPLGSNPRVFQGQSRRRTRQAASGVAPTLNQDQLSDLHGEVSFPERKQEPSDVFLRVFGTTVYANSYTLDELEESTHATGIHWIDHLAQMLAAKVDFTEAYPLYGDELIVPTVSGMSLWIHNEGAALLSLKYSHIMSGPTQFSPKFSPGFSIANTMKMSIAGEILEAGLRAETKLGVTTELDLVGTYIPEPIGSPKEGFGIEIKVNLPQTDVNLIDFSNELFWTAQTRHSDYDAKVKFTTIHPPKTDIAPVCTKHLQKIIGAKACLQVQLPQTSGRNIPSFPLSGHAVASLKLSAEPGATQFIIKKTFGITIEGEKRERNIQIEFNTVGTSENTKVELKNAFTFNAGRFEKFSIEASCPRRKVGFSYVQVLDQPTIRDITYKVYLDTDEFKLVLKNRRDVENDIERRTFGVLFSLPDKPEIELISLQYALNIPDPDKAAVERFSAQHGLAFPSSNVKFYRSINFKLNDFNYYSATPTDFIVLGGTLEVTPDKQSTVSTFKITNVNFSLRGNKLFTLKGNGGSSHINLLAQVVDSDFQIDGDVTRDIGQIEFKGKLTSEALPKLNSEIYGSHKKDQREARIFLETKQVGPKSDGALFKFEETIDLKILKLNYELKAVYPPLNVDLNEIGALENTAEKFYFSYFVSSSQHGGELSDIKIKVEKNIPKYDIDLTVGKEGNKLIFKSSNSKTNDRETHDHSLQVGSNPAIFVKAETFESSEEGRIYKNRQITVSTNSKNYPDPYSLKIKSDIDPNTKRPFLFTTGKGSFSANVFRGTTKAGAISISNTLTAGPVHDIKTEIFVERAITGKLGVKLNPSSEKIEVDGTVQAEGKPKREVQIVLAGNDGPAVYGKRNFGFSFALNLDADANDNSKKISVTSSNSYTQEGPSKELKSENTVALLGAPNKVTITVHAKGIRKNSIKVEHVDPNKGQSTYEVKAEIESSPETHFLEISHSILRPNGNTNSGDFAFGLKNYDSQKRTGHFLIHYENEVNGKQSGRLIDLNVKSELAGERRSNIFTLKGLKGVFTEPADFDITLVTGGGLHEFKGFVGLDAPEYKRKHLYFKIEKTPDPKLETYRVDLSFDDDYHDANGPVVSSNGIYSYRFASFRDFEVYRKEAGEVRLANNGKLKFDLRREVKLVPGLFNIEGSQKFDFPPSASNDLSKFIRSSVLVNGKYKITLQKTSEKFGVKVYNEVNNESGEPIINSFDLETTKDPNNLVLSIAGRTPVPQFAEFSFKINRQISEDGLSKRYNKVVARLNEKELNVESSLSFTRTIKTADVTVKLPDQPARKLHIKYDSSDASIPAEVTIEGVDVKSTGKLTRTPNDGFIAKFALDLKTRGETWDLEVSRTVQTNGDKIGFSASSAQSPNGISASFERAGQLPVAKYNGFIKVDLSGALDKYDLDGTYNIQIDQDLPTKSITANFATTALGTDKRNHKIWFKVEKSTGHRVLKGSYCYDEKCFKLNSALNKQSDSRSYELSFSLPEGNEAKVLAKTTDINNGETLELALDASYKSQRAGNLAVGFLGFKKLGSRNDLVVAASEIPSAPAKVVTHGIEVTVLEKTLAAHITCANWNSVDGEAHELKLWFDKKSAPSQNLIVGISKVRASVQEENQGKDVLLVIRHHKLPRDLRWKTKYRYGISSKVFEATLEADVFKKEEDKLVYYILLTHDVTGTGHYALTYSVTSAGQGISAVMKCDSIEVEHPVYRGQCNTDFKVPGVSPINSKVIFDVTEDADVISVYRDGVQIFYLKENIQFIQEQSLHDPSKTVSSPIVYLEYQLPGMGDTRIVNAKVSRRPFRVHLDVKPSSPKSYGLPATSFWIGATHVFGGGFGLSRIQDDGTKTVLLNFDANLRAKHLELGFDWNRENIVSYLQFAARQAEELKRSSADYCAKTIKLKDSGRQAVHSSFRAASHDFEPVFQYWESQLTDISALFGRPAVRIPRINLLPDQSEPSPCLIGDVFAAGSDFYQALSRASENSLQALAKRGSLPNPQDVAQRARKVRNFVEGVANKIREFIQTKTNPLKEKYPILKKVAVKIRETLVQKIRAANDLIGDDLAEFYPYPEVTNFLDDFNDYIEVALLQPEKITQANRSDILNDFEKAIETIQANAYSLDFGRGRLSANIPLISEIDGLETEKHDAGLKSECVRSIRDDPSSVFPPVNASALIFGNGQYLTFDGVSGTFERTCHYLMASDFVNKNFTVTFDHGSDSSGRGIRSTLFITDHKTTIGLQRTRENTIEVNVNGNLLRGDSIDQTATRFGAFVVYTGWAEELWTIVEGDMGVTLGCAENPAVCAVQISGFYHSNVEGVLGKFNNEPEDDFTIPKGQVVTDENIFTRNWRLDKQCSGKQIARKDEILDEVKRKLNNEIHVDNFFTRSKTSPHRVVSKRNFLRSPGLFTIASSPTTHQAPSGFVISIFFFLFSLLKKFFH